MNTRRHAHDFASLKTLLGINTVVVYNLRGKPGGRFTFWWVNGKQISGLVNFVPESRFPFAQISSIYWKTDATAWNWYQRWLWRNVTRIVGTFTSKKQDYLFRCSFAPGIFPFIPVYRVSDLFSTDSFLLVSNSLLFYLRSCNFHLFIEKNIYIFHMYSFLEYCRLLIITLFPETQFHVILVIAPYAKPRNCQNDDFSPADFCWESTWFLVMRDLAFESSDGYYTVAFWLLCLFMWS